ADFREPGMVDQSDHHAAGLLCPIQDRHPAARRTRAQHADGTVDCLADQRDSAYLAADAGRLPADGGCRRYPGVFRYPVVLATLGDAQLEAPQTATPSSVLRRTRAHARQVDPR